MRRLAAAFYVPVALIGVPVVSVGVAFGALVDVFVVGPVDIVSSVAVFATWVASR